MPFLLQIAVISVITALALLVGGWIATSIIKMDNRNNLADW